MANKLVNSSVADTLFTINGSAISSTTQPTNSKSTVYASISNTATASNVVQGNPDLDVQETRQKSLRPLGSQTTNPSATFSGVVANGVNTKVQYHGGTALNTYFSEDDIVLVNDVGFAKVVSVEASGVTVNIDSTASGNISSTNPVQIVSSNYLTASRNDTNNNGIMGYTSQIIGAANTAIQGGATAPNKAINRTNNLITRRVGTAIRNNQWSAVSGKFTTEPSNDSADYVATISGDKPASGIYRMTYEFGSTIPTSSTPE